MLSYCFLVIALPSTALRERLLGHLQLNLTESKPGAIANFCHLIIALYNSILPLLVLLRAGRASIALYQQVDAQNVAACHYTAACVEHTGKRVDRTVVKLKLHACQA